MRGGADASVRLATWERHHRLYRQPSVPARPMAGDTGLMRRGGRSGIEPLGRECAIIDCVEGIPVRHSAIRHSDVLGADGREERARVWAGRQPADWAGIASREAFESRQRDPLITGRRLSMRTGRYAERKEPWESRPAHRPIVRRDARHPS